MDQSEGGAKLGTLITLKRVKITSLVLLALAVVCSILFWIFFLNEVKQHEIGYTWDRRTGEITILSRTGYIITPPWLVTVHAIDVRPQQVCNSANRHILNCKLVQFNPVGLKLFLSWHGIQDGTVSEILKSYAYDGQNKSYPFLIIKTELGAQSSGVQQ